MYGRHDGNLPAELVPAEASVPYLPPECYAPRQSRCAGVRGLMDLMSMCVSLAYRLPLALAFAP